MRAAADNTSPLDIRSDGRRSIRHLKCSRKGDVLVAQPCVSLCDPIDCCPPGSSVQRILHWSGQSFPPPRGLPNPGMEPRSPALQADSSPAEPPGKPWIANRKTPLKPWKKGLKLDSQENYQGQNQQGLPGTATIRASPALICDELFLSKKIINKPRKVSHLQSRTWSGTEPAQRFQGENPLKVNNGCKRPGGELPEPLLSWGA